MASTTNAPQRIRFKCPNCDHPIVTVPEDYEIGGTLICPGCGAEVALPGEKSLLEKAENTFADIFGRKNRGAKS